MIEKISPIYFTYELYDRSLSILREKPDLTIDKAVLKYSIGWCDGMDTAVPSFQKAMMFEAEDGTKSWFHVGDAIMRLVNRQKEADHEND